MMTGQQERNVVFSKVDVADRRATITVEIDGRSVTCRKGDTVAAAVMLGDDGPYRRNPVSGAAREPYCMMGICFECLIEIDGVANQQGCLRTVEPGMRIRRQRDVRPLRERDEA